MRDLLHTWDSACYPPAYLRSGIRHDAIVAHCIAWMKSRGHFAVEVDVGGKRLRGRAAAMGVPSAALRGCAGGSSAGIVDLVGVANTGRAIFVEVKAPAWLVPSKRGTGRLVQKRAADVPTAEQLAFLREVHRRGAFAGVAWHAFDLESIFREGQG